MNIGPGTLQPTGTQCIHPITETSKRFHYPKMSEVTQHRINVDNHLPARSEKNPTFPRSTNHSSGCHNFVTFSSDANFLWSRRSRNGFEISLNHFDVTVKKVVTGNKLRFTHLTGTDRNAANYCFTLTLFPNNFSVINISVATSYLVISGFVKKFFGIKNLTVKNLS